MLLFLLVECFEIFFQISVNSKNAFESNVLMDKSKLLKLLGGLFLIVSVFLLAIFIYRSRMSHSTSAQEIADQLKSMESRYLKHEGFPMFVTTYNVNKKSPNEDDKLGDHWLTGDSNSSDIYAIGLQEVDLTREETSLR